MKILVFLFIFNTSFALDNYYPYDKKEISITSNHFNRYAIPQIREIYNGFFSTIKKISIDKKNDLINDFIKFENFVFKRNNYINKESYKYITSFEYKTISKLNSSNLKNGDDIVLFNKSLMKLKVVLVQALYTIEYSLTNSTNNFDLVNKRIRGNLKEILSLLKDLILVRIETKNIRNAFSLFWSEVFVFFKEKILIRRDQKFLKKNLFNFNLSWNTFHRNLAKGNHAVEKTISNYLDMLHKRWNYVLKLYYRK